MLQTLHTTNIYEKAEAGSFRERDEERQTKPEPDTGRQRETEKEKQNAKQNPSFGVKDKTADFQQDMSRISHSNRGSSLLEVPSTKGH